MWYHQLYFLNIKLWQKDTELWSFAVFVWDVNILLAFLADFLFELCDTSKIRNARTKVFEVIHHVRCPSCQRLKKLSMLFTNMQVRKGREHDKILHSKFLFHQSWWKMFNHFGNVKKHEPRKKPSYFPIYWMVNRDPYSGLLYSPYNWVGFHPLYNPTNQGFFHSSHHPWKSHGYLAGSVARGSQRPAANA